MTKTIDTLLEDIDALFDGTHKVNEDNLKVFADNLAKLVKEQMEKKREAPHLRMSMLGLPDRKLYFDINNPSQSDNTNPRLQQQFLFGHIIEALLFFLIKEAGHTVTHEQATVEYEGIKGHTDGAIDGVVADTKSVSQYMFPKFYTKQTLKNNDSFGYIMQLAGYRAALAQEGDIDPDRVALLAQNKSDARKSLLIFDEMELPDVKGRINHVKKLLKAPEPPAELCYTPVPKGKSGNEVLASGCKFCHHKNKCFKDLRVFKYSNGLEYFSKVVSEPEVPEVKFDKEEIITEEAEA